MHLAGSDYVNLHRHICLSSDHMSRMPAGLQASHLGLQYQGINVNSLLVFFFRVVSTSGTVGWTTYRNNRKNIKSIQLEGYHTWPKFHRQQQGNRLRILSIKGSWWPNTKLRHVTRWGVAEFQRVISIIFGKKLRLPNMPFIIRN